MKRLSFLIICICALYSCCNNAVGVGEKEELEKKVEWYLSQMTLEEKVGILHAQSKFSSRGVPRLGIPELWTDDGPHGVRPETLWDAWAAAQWTNDSCTAYPSLTCLAATWDREIARVSLLVKTGHSWLEIRKRQVVLQVHHSK